MAIYSEEYMQAHCIDVFFSYNGKPIHVLTDGCGMPEQLNVMERNRAIQKQMAINVRGLEGNQEDIIINQSYLNLIREEARSLDVEMPEVSELTSMFAPIASLGFYSYDCIRFFEHHAFFKLVAKPKREIRLPEGVLLPEYNGIDVLNSEDGEEMEMIVWRY